MDDFNVNGDDQVNEESQHDGMQDDLMGEGDAEGGEESGAGGGLNFSGSFSSSKSYSVKEKNDSSCNSNTTTDQSGSMPSKEGAVAQQNKETMASSYNFILSMPFADGNKPLDFSKLCSSFLGNLIDVASSLVTTVTSTKVEEMREIYAMDLDIKRQELAKAKSEAETAEIGKTFLIKKLDLQMVSMLQSSIPQSSMPKSGTMDESTSSSSKSNDGDQATESNEEKGDDFTKEVKDKSKDGKRKRANDDEENPSKKMAIEGDDKNIPQLKTGYETWTSGIDMATLPEYTVGKTPNEFWQIIFGRFPSHEYKVEFAKLLNETKTTSKELLKTFYAGNLLFFCPIFCINLFPLCCLPQ